MSRKAKFMGNEITEEQVEQILSGELDVIPYFDYWTIGGINFYLTYIDRDDAVEPDFNPVENPCKSLPRAKINHLLLRSQDERTRRTHVVPIRLPD